VPRRSALQIGATWLHKARALPKEDFRREVEKELAGKKRNRRI
jgi:hypothetical protein